MPLLLTLLYAVSGAVGLAWQVFHVRLFVPVFGAGAEAVAAVTASFLGGLGLGGWLAPRLLRRGTPLRTYGFLEIGVGLWGAALPWMVAASEPFVVGVLRAAGDGALALAVRVVLAALLVGPMATALGATFPLVAVALDSDARPARVGLLYGVNAIGAAGGALLAGLWLPWALGLRTGSAALGLGNLLVGGAAVALARGAAAPSPAPPPAGRSVAPALWVVAFVTGFVGMGLELCWTRMAGPLVTARSGSDAVAFAVVLAAVVLGIGIGGVLARRARDGLARPLALSQGLLCLFTLATLEPLRQFVLGDARYELVEGMLPLVPAVMLGATFPLLSNALAEAGTVASRGLGRLYAVNTLGCVLGSLTTGFLTMPAVGAQRLAVVYAGLSALVALSGWWRSGSRRAAAGWVLLSGGALALLAWRAAPVAGARLLPPFETVIDALEGRQASTLVSGRAGGHDRALTSGGHRIGAANVGGPFNDHALRALGPARLHPDPRRVLAIGLGTGATAAAFLSLESLEELVVVELDPNMRRLLRHFGTEGILDDPRLRLVDGDGRWFVRANDDLWDVVSVDAYGPRTTSAMFFTADFYREVRPRLAPGGLFFVKFNPGSLTRAEPLASYLATLWSAWPEGALVFVERGLFGLVGTEALDGLQAAQVVATRAASAALVAGARLHTDTRPVRVSGSPVADFALVQPYWEAQHGRRESPPWARPAGARR